MKLIILVVMIEIYNIDLSSTLLLPLFSSRVPAGFPSPAEDYIENNLDLNKYLIQHPSSTFFIKITGLSMIDANINPEDILIIDRSIKVKNNDVVLAILEGAFTVKRLKIINDKAFLYPENTSYKPIEISAGMDFEVWGKVIWSIHKH